MVVRPQVRGATLNAHVPREPLQVLSVLVTPGTPVFALQRFATPLPLASRKTMPSGGTSHCVGETGTTMVCLVADTTWMNPLLEKVSGNASDATAEVTSCIGIRRGLNMRTGRPHDSWKHSPCFPRDRSWRRC